MAIPIDWVALRKKSRTIPEFTALLLDMAEQLPPEERSAAIFEVFERISPVLNGNITREYNVLLERGASPREAMQLAVDVTLRARRKFLFRYIIGAEAPVYIKKYTGLVFSRPTDVQQDLAFSYVIKILHAQKAPDVYEPEDARWRLSETGFTPDFIDWAMQTGMEDPDAVIARYFKRLEAGEDRRVAVEDEIREYVFSLILDRIKGQPVSAGVDFCAAAIITIVCLAVTVACTVVSIVVDSVYSAKTSDALKKLEFSSKQALTTAETEAARIVRDSPLSEQEINECVMAAYTADRPSFQLAYAAMVDSIRVNRFGRTQVLNDEVTMLRQKWSVVELNAASGAVKTALAAQILNQHSAETQQAQQQKTSGMVTAGILGIGVLGVVFFA